MIHLCNNIYVTYAHTKQFDYMTDSIIVSEVRIKHTKHAHSGVLRQVKKLSDLFSNSIYFFDDLISKIQNGENHKIILYLDPKAFKEFIVKWMLSVYRQSDILSFKEILSTLALIEKDRSGGLRFRNYDNESIPYTDVHDLYWNIEESFIEEMHSKELYYDVNAVYVYRGFEHLIGNSILNEPISIKELKGKLPALMDVAIIREFRKVKFLFSERLIELAHSDSEIGGCIRLGSDFPLKILSLNPSYSKLLFKGGSDLYTTDRYNTMLLVADLFENSPLEVPICSYYKINSSLPSIDYALEDLLNDDVFEILYRYFTDNRYSPAWAEYIRSKSKLVNSKMFLAFGPQEA